VLLETSGVGLLGAVQVHCWSQQDVLLLGRRQGEAGEVMLMQISCVDRLLGWGREAPKAILLQITGGELLLGSCSNSSPNCC
jgi:hypothetical protein